MWFRNKTTGLVWEVEGDHADRLSRDPEYEKVEDPTRKQEPKKEQKVEETEREKENNKKSRRRKRDN